MFTDPQDGTNHTAGLTLAAMVAVPALGIPASDISVAVASASGTLAQEVVLQVGT